MGRRTIKQIIEDNMENKNKKKIYIAGKISGLPIEEYTSNFEKAKQFLLAQGYEVVSPIEHTKPTMKWEDCMKICLKLLIDCDGIYFMSNWVCSRGAEIEYFFVLGTIRKFNNDFIIIEEESKYHFGGYNCNY